VEGAGAGQARIRPAMARVEMLRAKGSWRLEAGERCRTRDLGSRSGGCVVKEGCAHVVHSVAGYTGPRTLWWVVYGSDEAW